MTRFVIDASVAVKWVVQEPGTPEALALRKAKLAAPDIITAECAKILWKKHRLGQLTSEECALAAKLLERSDIELVATGAQLHRATALAIDLDHLACDCFYVARALERDCAFATADQRLLRKARESARKDVAAAILGLSEAAAAV